MTGRIFIQTVRIMATARQVFSLLEKLQFDSFSVTFHRLVQMQTLLSFVVISGPRRSRVNEREFGPIFIHLVDRYKTIVVERSFN